MRSRTKGTANETLLIIIRAYKDDNLAPNFDYLMDWLEKSFSNPHKRTKA